MLPRLRLHLRPSPLQSILSHTKPPFPKPHLHFPPKQSLQTSPSLRQRFQYVRFNDPLTQPGNSGKGGKGTNGRWTSWQRLWYRFTPGQRLLLIGFGGGAPIFYVSHLETVEITGRRRFIFMSRSMEEALGKMVIPLLNLRTTVSVQKKDSRGPRTAVFHASIVQSLCYLFSQPVLLAFVSCR